MTKIFIRADGSTDIGLGHIIRTCALAEMLKAHFTCTFFVRNPSEYIREEVRKTGSSLVALPVAHSYLAEAIEWTKTLCGNEIVILDGYHFNTAYQQQVKNRGCKLVCVDDIHAWHFVSDVIINHAGGVQPEHYSAEPYTKFCLGFDYALLRSCFLEQGKLKPRCQTETSRVFVCLGGADPHNYTMAAVLAIAARYSHLHFDVVIGGAYPHKEALVKALLENGVRFELHEKLDANAILDLMRKAPRAVCAPSSVSIEYLTTGGELYLLQTADNQEDINRYYQTQRLGFHFEKFMQPAEAFNKELQAGIFDGSQSTRIQTLFNNLTAN